MERACVKGSEYSCNVLFLHGSTPGFMLLHGCWHLEKLCLGGGAGKTLAHNPDPGFPPAVPTHIDPLRQDPDAISLLFGIFHVTHWKSKVHLKEDDGNWRNLGTHIAPTFMNTRSYRQSLLSLLKIFLFKKWTICNLFSYKTRPTKHHLHLSLIHIWRCRRSTLCRSRWSPYH